jgi:alanyl aminopeptidase
MLGFGIAAITGGSCHHSDPALSGSGSGGGGGGSGGDGDGVPLPRADGRLPASVRPTGYALDLVIDPSKPRFSGRVRIDVTLAEPMRGIVLHGRGLAIQRASLSSAAGGTQVASTAARPSVDSVGDPEELTLAFPVMLPAGPGRLEIDYEAPFADRLRGPYRVEDGGTWFAFTQFEPTDARRAFPCFDEPGYKTPFTLSITAPAGSIALANTPEVSRRVAGDRVTFTFETSPPLPTYLIAYAVGPFDSLVGSAEQLPVRLFATPGKAAHGGDSLSLAVQHLRALTRYFGQPYPYRKLDLLAVPSFGAGAMENAGLITFREELLLLGPGASTAGRRATSSVIAHELAHQWFGDLVTMAWWDDLWLNEAFASWMADKIVDEARPGTRARLAALASKSQVMWEDSLTTARRIRNPVRSTSEAQEAFDGVTYSKGRAVLAMTEAWLGEETFRDGIRLYLRRHAGGSATAEDLYAALGDASSGARPVSRVMESFTTATGFPVMGARLSCPAGQPPVVELHQEEYRTLGHSGNAPTEKLWRVPVCVLHDAAAPPSRLARACTLLETRDGRLTLPDAARCPTFVYANADEAGYFRVGMDRPTLARLSAVFATLPEAERFGVVSNAWAAVRSGALPASAFLAMATHGRRETSRLVWTGILDALVVIDLALVTEAARPAFARTVRELIGPTARRIGFGPRPVAVESDDDKLLRESLLTALAQLGEDPWALAEAARLARVWLASLGGTMAAGTEASPAPADPAGEQIVTADLARIALPLAARRGDATLWNQLVAVLARPVSPETRLLVLSGLTGFDDPILVERTLGLVLDGTIKAQDLRYVFPSLGSRRTVRSVVNRWVQRHLDQLTGSFPAFLIGRLVRALPALCDPGQIREAETLFRSRLTKVEGVDKDLRQSVEDGLRCAALADAQRGATSDWLIVRSAGNAPPR